jgi:hypothetical protein
MVDSASHIAEQNLGFELEWRLIFCWLSGRRRAGEQ